MGYDHEASMEETTATKDEVGQDGESRITAEAHVGCSIVLSVEGRQMAFGSIKGQIIRQLEGGRTAGRVGLLRKPMRVAVSSPPPEIQQILLWYTKGQGIQENKAGWKAGRASTVSKLSSAPSTASMDLIRAFGMV